ncbi:unnamed protein product [Ilex paraguariensis]|uniref:Uncharacterized protein n=1 Tax=Ilex paraguariensis TaxID=185542 RepID=A0ABC8TJE8_9AQUA
MELRNGDAEPETHDSAGERNLDTEVSSSERKRGTEVEEPSERNVIAENPTETATASLSSAEEGKLRSTESPPADDCCPICFCSFVFPCRAPCGHWYCGKTSKFETLIASHFLVPKKIYENDCMKLTFSTVLEWLLFCS